MKILLHSSFLWLFAGGFALGTAGLVAFHPADLAIPAAVSTSR